MHGVGYVDRARGSDVHCSGGGPFIIKGKAGRL
jgi:hypothetical protein